MSEPLPPASLEDFAIKTLHLSKMTGVGVAVHAVPDAFVLMQTGVGCKYKVGVQISWQDHVVHPNRHEAWTQINELSLIQGSSERIGPFARSRWERHRFGILVVVSAYFVELTGEDLGSAVRELADTLPCPALFIPTVGPNGGFFHGYAEAQRQMLALQDWSAPAKAPKRACIIGSLFTRYEQDCLADVAQLRRLCKVSGLDAGPIFFSGRPWSELRRASESGVVIELPYARPVCKRLRRLFKRRTVVPTELPMGLAGTRSWVRELVAKTRGDPALAEAWLQREEAKAHSAVQLVRRRLASLPVAIFADTPLAVGLYGMMVELGLKPVLVGLRDSTLGGERAFSQGLTHHGFELPAATQVLTRPSLHWLATRGAQQLKDGRFHLILGSSIELDVFRRLPNEGARAWMMLEIGFPSVAQHVVMPRPNYGFAGVIAWAQRILDVSTAGAAR